MCVNYCQEKITDTAHFLDLEKRVPEAFASLVTASNQPILKIFLNRIDA